MKVLKNTALDHRDNACRIAESITVGESDSPSTIFAAGFAAGIDWILNHPEMLVQVTQEEYWELDAEVS